MMASPGVVTKGRVHFNLKAVGKIVRIEGGRKGRREKRKKKKGKL